MLYSKVRARTLGLSGLAKFRRVDLWKLDLTSFDNVVIFGVNEMMPMLENKIETTCQQLTKSRKDFNVVACRFPLANRTPIKTIGTGIDTVWLYEFSRDGK